ncbi:MAG: Uncharacterised protein [Rhodospirillaceae bacterium]|nr:MAG: Uncharacterised protein [Rhodospirillaceae bacterium]
MCLHQVVVEVLVEEIADGDGPESQGFAKLPAPEVIGLADEVQQLLDVARLQRGRVRRVTEQEGPDEAALADDGLAEALVGVDVIRVVATDLAHQRVVVGVVGEIVAVFGKGGAGLVGDHLQPEPRQFEVAHDLPPQQ